MALFNWNAAFETGHPIIDSQHRHWVDLLNQLSAALSDQQRALGTALLNQFLDYTDYHFNAEERLMGAANYDQQAAHQAKHQEFAAQIAQYRNSDLSHEDGDALLAFLVRWLSEHILKHDRQMVKALLRAGQSTHPEDDDSEELLLLALQESETRFRLAADSAPLPLWMSDPTGARTFVNQAWLALTGGDEASLLDTSWSDWIHPDDRHAYQQQYRDAIARQETRETTYRVRTEGGGYRWISETIAPRQAADSRFAGLIGCGTDITRLKEAEALQQALNAQLQTQVESRTQALRDAQQQLVQSEKMAAVGHLAAGVAHEINNPVGYIKSNVGTLSDYVHKLTALLKEYAQLEPALAGNADLERLLATKAQVDPEFVLEDVEDLIQESLEGLERVQRIVQDLKAFSRVDSAEWEAVDLHQYLDSTLNVANNELKYKAEVIRQYGDLPQVECQPHALCQVFMNLLVNAAQAIEQRGTITLRTSHQNGSVQIEIEDTGSGIPESIQQQIFNPFFTTKPVGSGTGLGLSISYGIIERHRGEIAVQSEPGNGTCFTISLPVTQPEETAPLKTE